MTFTFSRSWLVLLVAIAVPATAPRLFPAPTLSVPAEIDSAPWDRLLKRYVDDRGLVAYAAWKAAPEDLHALDDFIASYAPAAIPAAGTAEIAALINAYNAITIRWILQNYPTESIRELADSWKAARWTIGGRRVSLDEIEHRNLRPLDGWRVHATIVCAARSCPPLRRTAYTAANLAALTDEAWTAWLAQEDLNQFDQAARNAELSPIFQWFSEDFTGDGALTSVLVRYAPAANREWLARGRFQIGFLDCDWGLNDQGGHGRDYHRSLIEQVAGHAR